ncbi:winged helix-turn-helix domain-containing protein [Enterococcus sp. AZ196]|uniref:winged helix-turn-helix domain-containing protein n=1 Tax=Enterococcus sp. AZ196 TaxID=2774659 RepID=UPI003D28A999
MRPILILTKNLVIEQELQQRLQHLNYEVFCSVELFDRLRISEYDQKEQKEWLDQFLANYQVVIISETISDNEIQVILPNLRSEERILLRKLGAPPSAKEEEQIRALGLNDWITADQSIDVLREQLSEKLVTLPREEPNIVVLYSGQAKSGNIDNLKNNLSNRELTVLDCLIQAQGEVVSREALCTHLWNEAPNNSHLSQASVLIKRIKMKLEIAGYDPELLKTIWGRGYLLAKSNLSNSFSVQTR